MGADASERREHDLSDEDLRAALDAQRAATEHWRHVAEQRGTALDAIRRRTWIRAVLAIERRTRPLQSRLSRAKVRLTNRFRQGGLIVRALPTRSGLARRRAKLVRALEDLPAQQHPARSISIVVVTDGPASVRIRVPPTSASEMIVISTRRDAGTVPTGSRVIDGTGLEPAVAAALGAGHATGDLLCFVAPTIEPLDESWLDRLAFEIRGKVAVSTPTIVHPERSLRSSTPHDLRVRMAGLTVERNGAGVPVVRANQSGADVAPRRPPMAVAAGSGACLLVDRRAYDDVGGLAPLGDLDAAAFDLCQRLREQGKSIVAVPSSIVVDHRPALSALDLTKPIRDTAWHALIERHGPTLVRSIHDDEPQPLSFALTIGAPSAKVAHRWGDWHLAHALGRSLRRLGHGVLVQTADCSDDLAGRSSDIHLVLRGLATVRRTPGQRHVLWIISHPELLNVAELDEADLVLVASRRFAVELRTRTSTPVEVLLQATDHRLFRPVPPDPTHAHPVVVVAKTRDVLRPAVADALAAGLRPAIYGSGWERFVDQDLIIADHVPNEELPVVYSSAGVVLNDHWGTMRTWGFVSNRLFDVLACGTPVISDHLPEVHEVFGEVVPMFRGPDELRDIVSSDLEDPTVARARAAQGRDTVLAAHTFDHRARELFEHLARHGLDQVPVAVG